MIACRKGTDLTVLAFGPEANHAVLTNPDDYHAVGPPGPRSSSQRRFQQGMFGLNGAQHLKHKRLLQPALSKKAVVSQQDALVSTVDRCLGGWQLGQRIDLYGAMKELSLTIAAKLLFGLEEIPRASELVSVFQDWLDCFFATYCEMVLPAEAPPGSYDRMLTSAAELEEHFRRLIRRRETQLRPDDGDLLGLLLQARQAGQLSELEVIGEVHTLLNASYQTTAAAMTWVLLLLAQHPETLHALHQELQANARLPSGEFSLLDRVLRESLRLLPPVVVAYRRLMRPAALLGQPLPAGSYVVLSSYVTHHMEEIFPEANRFRPERWLEQDVSPYEYLPFSAGPRMCLGTAFSLQMFQVVIAAMVRRFRLVFSPGTRVDRHSNLTLGVQGALPVTIVPQDGRFSAVPLTGNIHEMVDLPQPSARSMAA